MPPSNEDGDHPIAFAVVSGELSADALLPSDRAQLAPNSMRREAAAVLRSGSRQRMQRRSVADMMSELSVHEGLCLDACKGASSGRMAKRVRYDQDVEVSALVSALLTKACEKGHLDLAQLLLDALEPEVNVLRPSSAGDRAISPLHAAVASLHHPVAELLLRKGADPNLKDKKGMTPLSVAIQKRSVALVSLLLDHGASMADAAGRADRGSVLVFVSDHVYYSHAAEEDFSEVFRLLIERGAPVEEELTEEHLVLLLCGQRGQMALCRELVGAGANIFVQHPATGDTILHNAGYHGDLRLTQMVLDAARRRGVLKSYMEVKNVHENPAVYHAALKQRAAVVKLLLDSGADPNVHLSIIQNRTREEDRTVCIHVTAAKGFANITELFLAAGSDPNASKVCGCTPLFFACVKERARTARVLLRHGAVPQAATEQQRVHGACPVNAATRLESTEILRDLLDSGANVTTPIGNGRLYPVHQAVESCNLATLRVLVARRGLAQLRLQDGAGRIAVDAARETFEKAFAEYEKACKHQPPLSRADLLLRARPRPRPGAPEPRQEHLAKAARAAGVLCWLSDELPDLLEARRLFLRGAKLLHAGAATVADGDAAPLLRALLEAPRDVLDLVLSFAFMPRVCGAP